MRRPLATCAALAATCLVAAAFHAPDGSAVPRKGLPIIMLHGGPLEAPVYMRDNITNIRVLSRLLAGNPAAEAPLPAGEVVEMAFFIHPDWRYYTHLDSLPKLRPEQANRHGRLHLGTDGTRVVVEIGPFVNWTAAARDTKGAVVRRYAPADVLEILRGQGVPLIP